MLKGKIQKDLLAAVKKREEFNSSVLRLLLAAILNKEKEKRYKISQDYYPPTTRGAQTKVWEGGGRVGVPAKGGAPKKEFKEEELEKESQLTDEEVIGVISSEIKKKREAIFLFDKGKRDDLVEKEKRAIEIWQKYLPEQLSEEEIRKLVEEAIEKTGAKETKDMGKVMAELMPKVKGRADGSSVSKIVKELLTSR